MLIGDLGMVGMANLPTLLYLRNPGHKGNVKVTTTKIFTEQDKIKRRQSMCGRRLMEPTRDTAFFFVGGGVRRQREQELSP